MRPINKLIIHCSDSEFGDADLIDAWHKEKGWSGIGYHYVILNGYRAKDEWTEDDGVMENGRDEEEVGSHCKGHNKDSIGICLIGRKGFTDRQMIMLRNLVEDLTDKYDIPYDKVYGHYELDPKKTCPNFNMNKFREDL